MRVQNIHSSNYKACLVLLKYPYFTLQNGNRMNKNVMNVNMYSVKWLSLMLNHTIRIRLYIFRKKCSKYNYSQLILSELSKHSFQKLSQMALSVFQGEAKTGYRLLFMTSTTRKHAFVFDVRLSQGPRQVFLKTGVQFFLTAIGGYLWGHFRQKALFLQYLPHICYLSLYSEAFLTVL